MPYVCKQGRGVEQVQEEGAYASINIHDQVGGLLQGVRFHLEGVVQVLGAGEELERVLLQQLDSLVTIILQRQHVLIIPCFLSACWHQSRPRATTTTTNVSVANAHH